MTRDDLGLPKGWDYAVWLHTQKLYGQIAAWAEENPDRWVGDMDRGLVNAATVARHYNEVINSTDTQER
jgi:hypothetical protein